MQYRPFLKMKLACSLQYMLIGLKVKREYILLKEKVTKYKRKWTFERFVALIQVPQIFYLLPILRHILYACPQAHSFPNRINSGVLPGHGRSSW